MLHIIGLGLDNNEITRKGIEALKKVDKAYAEFYTNTANIDLESLPCEVELLEREEVEQEDKILKSAETQDTAFLVSGDPLTATTHYDIKHRAEEKGLEVEVVHAPSIFTSVAETGLNIYKFGRTVTLPENGEPESIVEHIGKNDSVGLHTLVLLDIDLEASKAAQKLLDLGLENREAVVIERANREDMNVKASTLKEISDMQLGDTPHSIVLTGEKSFKEEEFLESHE
ncbi:MAG: diphthine synthase [Candidatus Nanohaloarchaea archaeon]